MRSLLIEGEINSIASHSDADGISAAVLLYLGLGSRKLKVGFPDNFQNVQLTDGEVADVVLDKVPPSVYSGLVIDHHSHPQEPQYSLYYGERPTSLLVLEVFEDLIPKNERWKVVIGGAGDMEPEKIPSSIWLENQFLLESTGNPSFRYGLVKVYASPVWTKISSPISTCCRVRKPMLAFNRLLLAKEPRDLLKDSQIQQEEKVVWAELNRLDSQFEVLDMGPVQFCQIESSLALVPYHASRLYGSTRKTTIVVDSSSGVISLRGILCDLIREKLPEYNIGGHPNAMGGEIPPNKTPEDLLRDLRNVF